MRDDVTGPVAPSDASSVPDEDPWAPAGADDAAWSTPDAVDDPWVTGDGDDPWAASSTEDPWAGGSPARTSSRGTDPNGDDDAWTAGATRPAPRPVAGSRARSTGAGARRAAPSDGGGATSDGATLDGATSGGATPHAVSSQVAAPDVVASDSVTSDGDAGARGADADTGGRRGGGGTPRRGGAARRGGRRRSGDEPPAAGAAAVDAEPDPESVAKSIALRLLTGAPRSRAQLAEAMARRDVPEEVAERVLDRFTEVGLIDDAAYAEILVRSRHAERGLSRRALAQELRRRGVDDEVAAEALEQVDDEDEEAAARQLARRKLRATRGLDREVRMRRTYGALGRKGYGGALVARVVREELAAEGDTEEPDGF